MKTLIVFLTAATSGISATAYAQSALQAAADVATREWTKGNTKFTARFERVRGNTAIFSKVGRDGKSRQLMGAALESLNQEDRAWIREYVKGQRAEKLAAWKQSRTRLRQSQRLRRY